MDNYHNEVYMPILGAANECGTLSEKWTRRRDEKERTYAMADVRGVACFQDRTAGGGESWRFFEEHAFYPLAIVSL